MSDDEQLKAVYIEIVLGSGRRIDSIEETLLESDEVSVDDEILADILENFAANIETNLLEICNNEPSTQFTSKPSTSVAPVV